MDISSGSHKLRVVTCGRLHLCSSFGRYQYRSTSNCVIASAGVLPSCTEVHVNNPLLIYRIKSCVTSSRLSDMLVTPKDKLKCFFSIHNRTRFKFELEEINEISCLFEFLSKYVVKLMVVLYSLNCTFATTLHKYCSVCEEGGQDLLKSL